MYNQSLKLKYIDHCLAATSNKNVDKYRQSIENLFNRLEPYESTIKKDISGMTKDETLNLLSHFLCGGKDYQATNLSFLTQYVNWCIENGYSSLKENILIGLNLSSIDVSESYANSMVKDEEDLIQCLNLVFAPLENDFVDNLYRCFLILVFYGISTEDVLFLKTEDLDVIDQTINYSGNIIKFSNAAFEIISHTINMEDMYKNWKQQSTISKPIVRHGYLIENTVDDGSLNYRRSLKVTFDSAISAKFRKCQRALTQLKIANSGVFYRMYLNEKNTGKIDCYEYLAQRKNNIETMERPERVAERCSQEYVIWKRAFNLF